MLKLVFFLCLCLVCQTENAVRKAALIQEEGYS